MTNIKPAVAGVLIVVGVGVGFGGGYLFRNHQMAKLRGNFTTTANGTFQRFNGTRGMGQAVGQNGMFRGGVTQGEILSMDESSITVKMQDGSSKIVLFSDSTLYSNSVTSTKSDLKTGISVAVFGTPNSDGSITATTIQLNPVMVKMQGSPIPEAK